MGSSPSRFSGRFKGHVCGQENGAGDGLGTGLISALSAVYAQKGPVQYKRQSNRKLHIITMTVIFIYSPCEL